MQQSKLYILDRLPMRLAFPNVTSFLTKILLTWRHHRKQLLDNLDGRLAKAKSQPKSMSADAAAEIADNTLNHIVAQEVKGYNQMPAKEVKDELYQYLVA